MPEKGRLSTNVAEQYEALRGEGMSKEKRPASPTSRRVRLVQTRVRLSELRRPCR